MASRVDFWTHHGDGSALVTGAAVTVPVAVILAALWFIHIRLHDSSVRTLVPFSVAIVVVLSGTYTAVPELVAGLACAALLAVELILTEGKSETV
nr:hypothetical protein [Rhodococcus qingshengii]